MIIKIKASANMEVFPDFMNISIKFRSLNMDKEKAISMVLDNFKDLKEFLNKEGISEKLETISYKIEDIYDYKENKILGNNYTKVFKGFLVTQNVNISIPLDVLLATKLIATKTKKDEVYINVNYSLKDSKKFQDDVIKAAIDRAKEKALVVASSFGKDSVNCKVIDYTYNNYNHYYSNNIDIVTEETMKSSSKQMIEEVSKTLEPSKISLTESIYSEWEI